MADHKKEPSFVGDDLSRIINNAIRSGDYSSLNREVTKALNKAADALHDGVTEAVLGRKTDYYRTKEGRTYRGEGSAAYDTASSRVRHTSAYNEAKEAILGTGGVASPVGSAVKMVLTGLAAIFFGIFTVGGIATSGLFNPITLFFAALTGFTGWSWFKCGKKLQHIRRARKILQMMSGRDTITVEEVASAFGMDSKKTADEIQEMIRTGVFTGPCYMDKEETAFMTSRSAYKQYLDTMAAYQQRAAQEQSSSVFKKSDLKEYNKMQEGIAARERSEAARNAQLSKETAEMLEEGQAFIAHIHAKNAEIPGEEFTEKLNRLEKIVTDIFARVAADPESAPDLHRMMKYYLPLTQKLVDTYATLDKQSVSGENIQNAKREIEASLDTINSAFERFLDSFFQHTAWDVSSDISVLGTMMAQDGLTGGGDFKPQAAPQAAQQTASQVQTAGAAQAQAASQVQAAGAAQTQATGAAQVQMAPQAAGAAQVQKEAE